MLEDDDFRLCRLCLKSGDWTIDIFDPKGTSGFLVWSIMKELVDIQATQDDGLPHTICHSCMEKLLDLKNFKKICIRSNIRFLKLEMITGVVNGQSTLPRLIVE